MQSISFNLIGEDVSEEKLLQPSLERADCLHRDVSTSLPGGKFKMTRIFLFKLTTISSEDQDTTARE